MDCEKYYWILSKIESARIEDNLIVHSVSTMRSIVTEKEYPIRNIWLLKHVIASMVLLVVAVVLRIQPNERIQSLSLLIFSFFVLANIPLILSVFISILRRSNFHFALEEKFIVLHQGIIAKENRNIPYGRIQSVILNQRMSDRILGVASITIEDFSHRGRSDIAIDGFVGRGKYRREMIGFLGNRVHIPGLRKNDAEALKERILQKIKENPIEDSQSGL
jgi:membrane protein YdbS with pleckstrin-like domain